MENKIFDPKKLDKLNNPERYKDMPPYYIYKKLNLEKAETIVDIGAGTGYFCIPFLKLFNAKKVYAADISEVMNNWVKENVSIKYNEICPILMKNNSVKIPDNSSDLIYMMNLHHELYEPENMLREIYRLLKNKGKIFIVDWLKKETNSGPPIEIRCDVDDVKTQLLETGFKNIEILPHFSKHFFIIAQK